MKKVLSFVLVLSLVLGSFSMAFAATPTDVVGKTCENAVQALSDLGVVSGYTDGTYKPENPVNRAEACKLIIAALGLEGYAAGVTSTTFTDLDGYGWAVGYIGYAQQLGLVNGVGNNKFNPGGPVTYEQWATMLVRALGYTDEVLQGTWPANYMIKAQSLGIMKDIKAAGNAAANRGDVAIMLYNDLHQSIGTINKDGEFVENIGRDGVKGTDTMLSRLEKTSTANYSVFTDVDLANVADGINLRSYLGANVKVYLNDDKEIIGIKDCNSTFLTGDWNGKDTLTVGDVDYTVKKTTDAAVICTFLNGKEGPKTDFDSMTKADDVVFVGKVSGKTMTEVFSVMKWDATDEFRFEDGDLNTAKAKLNGKKFAEDKNGEIDTTSFELLGVSSLDKITTDNIVTIYEEGTTAKYIRRIAVGTKTVEGEITKVSSKGDKFTIDGTAYEQSDDFFGEAMKLSEGGKAWLNYDGKIADWEATSGVADNYAILLGKKTDDDFGDVTHSVKLFTAEGKEVVYDLDDITAAAFKVNDLIKYGLNNKGEIDVLEPVSGGVTGTVNGSGTTIGNVPVEKDIVVFIYDGKDWDLGSLKDFDDEENVQSHKVAGITADAYADKDKKVAAIALEDSINGSNYVYGVINNIFSKTTDEKEKYWAIDGFADGAALNMTTSTKTNQKTLAEMTTAGFDLTTTLGGLVQIKVKGDDAKEVATVDAIIPDEIKMVELWGGTGAELKRVRKSDNTLVIANDDEFKLDAKAVVYKWDDDEEEWTMTDISGLAQEDMVKLYQTDDSKLDGYNIVIAW